MPENDDELEQLRRANPVAPGSVPSADSPRARALFEEITMSDDAAFTNRQSAIGSSRRRWVGGIAAAIVLIGSGAAAVVLRGADGGHGATDLDAAAQPDEAIDCPDRPRPPAPEERSNTLSSPMLYSSLDDLTGASELVVLGEVTEVGRGEISGAQPGHAGFQSVAVTLKVKEVYRGEASGDTVVFHESGWSLGPPEQPTTEAGVHRSQVGDCGFYFLATAEPGSALSLTSIQGRFIAEGEDGIFAGYEQSNALSDELAAMSFTELRAAIEEAAERMKDTSARDVACSQPGPRPLRCGESTLPDRPGEEDEDDASTSEGDRAAQSDLRNAFTTARVISTDYQGRFQKNPAGDPIDAAAMQEEDPNSDLAYGAPGSAGVDLVSVAVGSLDGANSHIWLVTQSSAGTFYCLGGTWTGEVSRSMGESEEAAKATCVGGAREW